MIVTIIYGLICWTSGDIHINNIILAATVILDIALMVTLYLSNRLK